MLHGNHGRVLDRAPHRLQPRQSRAGQVLPPAISPWHLTALLHQGRLNVFRARPISETTGPGYYAVKVARATAETRLVRAMLAREIAVAESVQHPNLVSVLASRVQDLATPFVVMPYLEGLTLAQCSAASPRMQLPVATALWIVRQIAEALASLHAAGWLHGQVRPEHVIVSPQGHATLLDLSLARRLDTDECAAGGQVSDVPNYAAPEAFSLRGQLTPASDSYCLGLLLFELLTGRHPFANLNRNQLASAHQRAAPPDVRSLRPDAPHDLAPLLRLLLAKQPLRRPDDRQLMQSLAELEIAAI